MGHYGADLVATFAYDAAGQLVQEVDPNGNESTFEYDAALRRIGAEFAVGELGYTETYAYGGNSGSGAFSYTTGWQPTRIVNRRGFATDIEYDGFYRATREIRRGGAAEPTTEFEYNKVHGEIAHRILAEADGGNDRVVYTLYDALHRVVAEGVDVNGSGVPASGIVTVPYSADPADQVTVYTLDLRGNRLFVRDAEGNVTETVYDGANRPTEIIAPSVAAGVPTMLLDYDANGNVVLETDPNGTVTESTYDGHNRRTLSILDLDGDAAFDPTFGGTDIVNVTAYDGMGNVVSKTDSEGLAYTFVFDNAYRQTVRVEPPVFDAESGTLLTPLWRTVYDQNSNPIQEIDPRGVVHQRVFDGLNRMTEETVALGSRDPLTRSYTYDGNDNTVAQSLVNGKDIQETTFAYDTFDRLVEETWPGGLVTTISYFRNDLQHTKHDPRGNVEDLTYDVMGRVVEAEYPGAGAETKTFAYDLMNNLVQAVDQHGSCMMSYDALYRMVSEARAYTGPSTATGYGITHEFDLNGNRAQSIYPGTGRAVARAFDRLDRLESVTDDGLPAGSRTTSYAYDANSNQVLCSHPNGVVEARVYDPLNRVEQISATSSGGPIYSSSYTFDLVGNRLSCTEMAAGLPARPVEYRYDDQYRLVIERVGSDVASYSYDPAGNRLKAKSAGEYARYTYNDRNELVESIRWTGGGRTKTSYSHDGNGNLRVVDGTSGRAIYTWDSQNRLTAARNGGAMVFAAQYDYANRRLVKSEGGVDTFYVASAGLTYQEEDLGTGLVTAEFVHGNDMGGGVGAIAHSDRGLVPEFFTANHLGHTVALTDSAGSVVQTEFFWAFGESASLNGSSAETRKAYTKERDNSIALDYHGFRYYDPATGRYISRDPAGYVDGFNVFLHTGNNPINRLDPNGLDWESLRADFNRGSQIALDTIAETLFGAHDPLKGSVMSQQALAREQASLEGGAEPGPGLEEVVEFIAGVKLAGKAVRLAVKARSLSYAQQAELGGKSLMELPSKRWSHLSAKSPLQFGGARNVNAQDSLLRKLRALDGAQARAARTRTLPDGRIRYYTSETPATKPGLSRGRALVTEHNPQTGQVREWMEVYDHAGKVNRVHPKMLDGQILNSPHFPPTARELAARGGR